MSFPDPMLGFRRDLLKGDMYREWGRWFIEQFIDVKYLSSNVTYPEIFYDVFRIIDTICGWTYDRTDKMEVSGIISRYVLQRVNIITESNKRRRVSLSERRELLDLLGEKPRCWLTGMPFSPEAIAIFLGERDVKIKLPDYVDKYMPIGLVERDLKIEVDHLYPFALGGDDSIENFRLICGWANMVKSSQVSMYGRGTKYTKSIRPYQSIDNYYWAIRTLGLKRKCECDGCKNNLENSLLTISSFHGAGKIINPISMKIMCYEHAYENDRFVLRTNFEL
ncbi:hypothetical protein HN069_000793 [Salmonella enterica]|nr:hypothetical protein [Salmonella enterica]